MRTVRFLHTSDVHLDTSFAGSGFPSRLGARKREAIRATLRSILERARLESADLVLLAGDVFEQGRVSADSIEFLRQQLAALEPAPVFIAPGNHDPCVQGSPYRTVSWPSNVHVFREEQWSSVELPGLGLRVTGFGFCRAQIPEPPFQRLEPLPGGLLNIVVAHASDSGRVPAGKVRHAPFAAAELAGRNIAYCALGHYHQQRAVEGCPAGTVAWYCGIPEERSWDEEGAGGYLAGEADSGGVRVRPFTSGIYPLKTTRVECDGFSSREQVVEAVLARRGAEFDDRTILRVELCGEVDTKLDLAIPEMEERLAGAALFVRWLDRTTPALDLDELAREKTLRGRFVRSIGERMAAADGPSRAMLERALVFGIRALSGQEVRPR